MPTGFTLYSGPLSSKHEVSGAEETAARDLVLRAALAVGADPAWSNQQKLDHLRDYIEARIEEVGQEHWKQEHQAEFDAEAEAAVHW